MRTIISILMIAACFQSSRARSTEKANPDRRDDDPLGYVNPFIGTGGHGHTFPGATVPFGMVQLSPDQFHEGWDWSSGYHYSDSLIIGFSHTHFSGTGIGEMGDFSLMPFTGRARMSYGKREGWKEGYASRFSHDEERASAGYYSVYLNDHHINVELTATPRCGFHRYRFPQSKESHIILNLEHGIGWDWPTDASLTRLNDTLFLGYRHSIGWAKVQRVYVAISVSKAPTTLVLSTDSVSIQSTQHIRHRKARALLSFSTAAEELILVKVGLSYVSADNALRAIQEEIPHWDFDATRREAETLWRTALSALEIKGDSTTKRIAYTALYHAMLAPSLYQDRDGSYRGSEPGEKKIHVATGFTNHTVFSLWDTFRAWHPLATLLFPDKVRDFLFSMLAHYTEYGALPIWSLMSNESYVMIGYHALPVILDAFKKGFLHSAAEARQFYDAMKTTACREDKGLNAYRKWGYVPIEREVESVSKTLEYAFDDWCVYEMAKALGNKTDQKHFKKRAESYRALFDKATGFMRGRDTLGQWRSPFDPFNATHRNGDYTEGNAWQYTWSVQHNPYDLIRLMGGKRRFSEKLDSLFQVTGNLGENASPDISGLIGQYAHGNEPSHHIAYLYVYAGQPEKTADIVYQILTTLYRDTPDGICGNDDLGQLSAWYIWSALGMYPVNPASAQYIFGAPLFLEVSLKRPDGKKLTIRKEGSTEGRYIHAISRNGKPHRRWWISHQELITTDSLIVVMGNTPLSEKMKTRFSLPPSTHFD